jgi:hypothetical protein
MWFIYSIRKVKPESSLNLILFPLYVNYYHNECPMSKLCLTKKGRVSKPCLFQVLQLKSFLFLPLCGIYFVIPSL